MNNSKVSFDFSPMRGRPRLRLPNDARVAIYTVVNVEDWDIEKPVPRQYVASLRTPPLPDVQNWSWHEYGMRVGLWRLIEAMESRGLRATAAMNANLCRSYPTVAQAMLEAGWEFMGHGVTQVPMHMEPDERETIFRTVDLIETFTGRRPRGWLGPGLAETWETLGLLVEAGFSYVADWAMDEHPVTMQTPSGPIMAMPYSLELSDLPMMVVHHHTSETWLTRARAQFDRLYSEGADNPRIMSMSVHPYIMGVPHRIASFEAAYDHFRAHDGVWFATAEEIHDWLALQERDAAGMN